MPIGELEDLINLYLAREGYVTVRKANQNVSIENGKDYIPTNLR